VPVFVIFFAMAGAELRLQEFGAVWPLVLLIALARMGAIWGATTLAGRLAEAETAVVRYGWTGLVSQAGVALGLAAIVAGAGNAARTYWITKSEKYTWSATLRPSA